MKTWKCVKRHLDGNKIVGYTIVDEHGNSYKVKANELKTAINAGEALVMNLTLSSDGRLLVKANDVLDVTMDPRTPKIIDFSLSKDQIRGHNLLNKLFTAFDRSESDARIVECGFETTDKKTEAYLFLSTKPSRFERRKDFEFSIIHRENSAQDAYKITSPIGYGYTEDIDVAIYNLIDDFNKISASYNLRLLNNNTIESFYNKVKISKEFGEDITKPHKIALSGNNIIYLGPKDITLSTVEVPDFCTVVSNNAFEACSNISTIKSPVIHFNTIKDIIKLNHLKIRLQKLE